MKYIVKNEKIFGIASNKWDEIVGVPTINSTILEQGNNYTSADLNIIKHMTKAEYDALTTKNPNCYYVVQTDTSIVNDSINYLDLINKPLINNVMLTGNKSLVDLGIYSIAEVDNMLASMRSIKVVSTKPTSQEVIANTMYYVGTQAPYHVYLYDSNKAEIDLGSSEVDLSEYEKIERKTTTLNLQSTDIQYPSAKAVFDYTPQTVTLHYQAGTLTTMDEVFALLIQGEDTTHVSNTTCRAGVGYVSLPQFIINDLTAIGIQNNGYGNAFFRAQKVKSSNDGLYGYIELQYLFGTTIAVNTRSTAGWSGWKIQNSDNFAPMNSVNAARYHIIQVDDAVFNFTNQDVSTGYRQYERKTYSIGYITDPITNEIIYGSLRTEQSVVLTYQVRITQTITSDFHDNGSGMEGYKQKVFRRVGVLTANNHITLLNPFNNKASIIWQPWYPVEYPVLSLTLNSEVVGANSRADLAVAGGIATIRFNNLNFKSNIGTSATLFDNDARLSFLRTNKYQLTSTAGSYIWNVLISTDPTKTILVCSNPNLYAWGATANVGYYGLITIPLGY